MWSYRTEEGDRRPDELQAPIIELPFDTFANVKEDKLTLEGSFAAWTHGPIWSPFVGDCNFIRGLLC